ncbi:MAG: hypothetical protein U0105_18070 [Candidatus Obscuribacterales bacterium]
MYPEQRCCRQSGYAKLVNQNGTTTRGGSYDRNKNVTATVASDE